MHFAAFGPKKALLLCLSAVASAQQYAGEVIANQLPTVPGSVLTYYKIPEPSGKNVNLTLTNYMSLNTAGGKVDGAKVKRAVIVIHGLNRDPYNYMSYMLSALAQVPNSDVNQDSVAICAPYFPNGNDKTVGYPWTSGLAAGKGSTSSQLVWSGSNFADGANNQYPYTTKTVSSYYALDILIKYFDNKTIFPNMQQIVIAGHSLGAQTTQRYAAMGLTLSTKSPVSYYVANPDSFAWWSESRPLDTSACPTYDVWRYGVTNYSVECTYNAAFSLSGRANILAQYNSRQIAYARGTLDDGDDSSTCSPYSTGANRNERFFNFIKAFPPTCTTAGTGNCDTIDYVNMGHDAGGMFASSAGQARLFLDNFNGTKKMAYDFGYPRLQTGDDPYPDPSLATNATTINPTYAGNMTYAGCYEDLYGLNLPDLVYSNGSNTIELCTTVCSSAGYTVAGLEDGIECYCGTALASANLDVDAGCNVACAGNSSEICGDANRMSVYSSGNLTVLAKPSAPATVGRYSYLGCYVDNNPGRTLAITSTSGSGMTLESCAAFCSAYSYFGTEYSDECYCDNSLASTGTVAASTDCSLTCAGNATEYCGAGNRLTVYYTNSTTTSSSSTSTATSASSTLACPGSNGVTYNATSGASFLVECYIDHAGGDLTMTYATSLAGCINSCDSTTGCQAYSWVASTDGSSNPCYLKSSIGASNSNTGVWGGKLIATGSTTSSFATTTAASTTTSVTAVTTTTSATVSSSTDVSCPSSDGTYFTATDGRQFLIECYIDHAGGDLTMGYVTTLASCINLCDTTSGCQAYSWVATANGQNNPCYMKSSIGTGGANSGVWGGKLVAGSASSSTTSVKSSTTTTSAAASSTVSSTTTAATAAATATNPTCPSSDGNYFIATDGRRFLVECSVDHAGGDLTMGYVTSLAGCINLCDTTSGCQAFSWVASTSGASNPCYLKSSIGANNVNSGVWGGKLVAGSVSTSAAATTTTVAASSTVPVTSAASTTTTTAAASTGVLACPGSNGATYTASDGRTWLVECGIDHAGGDLTMQYATTLTGCIQLCDSTSGCVAYSWVSAANGQNGPCYMKSSVGASNSNSGVWGGKYLSGSAAASTNVVTSTAAGTATSATSNSAAASSSVATTSSTSSSAISSNIACPASDQIQYSLSSGQVALVECGIDHAGGDLTMVYATSLQLCINACASTSGCQAWSYVATQNGQTNPCYLKSSIGANNKNSGVWGGKFVSTATVTSSTASVTSSSRSTASSASSSSASSGSAFVSTTTSAASSSSSAASAAVAVAASVPACPASDGVTYTSSTGATFMVQCYDDHVGGDLSMAYATSLMGCINLCATTTGCQAYSFVATSNGPTNPCYMKSSIGADSTNSGVWGGKIVAAASSSSSISSSSSSSSTSTASTFSTATSAATTSASVFTSSSSATTAIAPTSSTLSTSTTTTTTMTTSSTLSTSTTTSSSTTQTFAAPTLPTGFSNMGCYPETSSLSALTYYLQSSSSNTPSQCAVACKSSGYAYAGTTASTDCYCGNELLASNSTVTSTDCNSACAGDSTQACGSSTRINIAYDTTWKAATSPLTTYGNWTLLSCYTDSSASRTLATAVATTYGINNVTDATCLDSCAASGYTYCGLEYYHECYGSTSKPSSSLVATSAGGSYDPYLAGCGYACSGNSTQSCGGANRILVYSLLTSS